MIPVPCVDVNTVPIALCEATDLVEWVAGEISSPTPGTRVVHHVSADPTVHARRDPDFSTIMRNADLNVADGMGVVWAVRLLGGGSRPRERVYGPDVMLDLLARGVNEGWSCAFFGGSEATLPTLRERILTRWPELAVRSKWYAPPFREVSPEAVAQDLSHGLGNASVDLLFVGLGTPKQQRWADLARHAGRARVILTVGAAFDFHAGTVRQAPAWMQRRGLEWLHRLLQDPRRLAGRYMVGNVRHVAGVVVDLISRRRAERRGGDE